MKRLSVKTPLLPAVAAAGAAGCATMGTGAGATPSGADPVSVNWKGSTASDSGAMTASLADSTTYTGQYFQVTRNTAVDTLGRLWVGWRGHWGGIGSIWLLLALDGGWGEHTSASAPRDVDHLLSTT